MGAPAPTIQGWSSRPDVRRRIDAFARMHGADADTADLAGEGWRAIAAERLVLRTGPVTFAVLARARGRSGRRTTLLGVVDVPPGGARLSPVTAAAFADHFDRLRAALDFSDPPVEDR